jgi:hypothetical protein
MNVIIFIWYLLSYPQDRMICSMWVQKPPTRESMNIAGCRWDDTLTPVLILKGIDLYTHKVVCERPAGELPTLTCDLWPLDNYLLQVWQPGYQKQLCTVSIKHEGTPTEEDIENKCPELLPGSYLAELITSYKYIAPVPPAKVCPMPELTADTLPPDYTYLATKYNYELLSYDLIWTYGNNINLIPWQNQFDKSIYDAGKAVRVPPKVLKSVIAQESQFWPTYSINTITGEIGLGQLTDNGADLVIRYTPELYNRFCKLAVWNDCSKGYDQLKPVERQMIRDLLRGSLVDNVWPPDKAANIAQGQIYTWSQVLAAYYCIAGEMVIPYGYSNSWNYALAAYHAGPECIRGGMICNEGLDYLAKAIK